MAISLGGVPPLMMQMPLREFLRPTIAHLRLRSLISLGEDNHLVYRLLSDFRQDWRTVLTALLPQVTEDHLKIGRANNRVFRPTCASGDRMRDAHLLAPHNLTDVQTLPGNVAAEPGLPELTQGVANSSLPPTQTYEPGLPASSSQSASVYGCPPLLQVPEVGEEIATLGQELGTALLQRRTAERRSIFAQRGRQRGPDDSPFSNHTFDDTKEYRRAPWSSPVPQDEWERRVYVELSLATDPSDEGKGAPPMCHACHARGGKAMPLA
eukprot:2790375-Amphidinium_carterae.1